MSRIFLSVSVLSYLQQVEETKCRTGIAAMHLKMELQIRTERPADFAGVEALIETAFADVMYSDHREHQLVASLRKSPAFIPDLSLVAEQNGKIVGHILLTRAQIQHGQQAVEILALAPVSVLPDFQNQGIGSKLIEEAHRRASSSGFIAIALLGHAAYYPRFGYRPAASYGLRFPFEAPDENCMLLELEEGALDGITGTVKYAEAFGSDQ
jgi:predicted N-acetyltransferase YhbS